MATISKKSPEDPFRVPFLDPWRSKNGSQTTSGAPPGTLPRQPSSRPLSQMTFCSESIAPAESKSTSRRPLGAPGRRSPPPLKKLFWKAFTYPAKRTLLSLGGPTRRAPWGRRIHMGLRPAADPKEIPFMSGSIECVDVSLTLLSSHR